MDDAQLIARSLNDPSWFEPLFDRYYSRIHRFCSARAGTDAADDLASETFTVAFRRRADFDPSYPDAAPWLYGIAVNVLRAFHRRERKQELLSVRASVALVSAGEGPGPSEGIGALATALQGLSEDDRDLIVRLRGIFTAPTSLHVIRDWTAGRAEAYGSERDDRGRLPRGLECSRDATRIRRDLPEWQDAVARSAELRPELTTGTRSHPRART